MINSTDIKQSLNKIGQGSIETFWRFPLSIICCLFFYIASKPLHWFIPNVPDLLHEKETTLQAISFCGCFLFISLRLFAESKQWRNCTYYLVSIPVFILIAWYLHSCPYLETSFLFLGSGLFLSMFIAPFCFRDVTSNQIWTFNYRLWFRIGLTGIAASILILGFLAILRSVDFLFGTNHLTAELAEDLWLIVSTLFAPIFAMTGVPKEFDVEEKNYPVALKIILSYVVLPLLAIYTAVLYIYIIKIVITWDLPKGGVAYLVSTFGCIGAIAYLASCPIHQIKGVSLFARHFFKILILALLLLAVGMGKRVLDYGFTEDRYTIVLCLIWLVISVCLAFKQKNKNAPKYIYSSLVLLLLLASFGPWGAVDFSASSQTYRLKSFLEKSGILVNDQIHKPSAEISLADRANISSMVEHLVSRNKEKGLSPWFAKLSESWVYKNDHASAKDIVQDMGIDYVNQSRQFYADRSDNVERFNYASSENSQSFISISGYDYYLTSKFYCFDKAIERDFTQGKMPIKVHVSFDSHSNCYSVTCCNTDETLVFDLTRIVQEIVKTKASNYGNSSLSIDKEGKTIRAKLIVNSLNGTQQDGKQTLCYIDTTLLIKKR